MRTDDLPKFTETNFAVLHLTQARFVEITLVCSRLSISSFNQPSDPPSTLFFNFRNSSLTSQKPLHFGQLSNLIENSMYSFSVWPQAGQTSVVPFSSLALLIGGTSTRKSVSLLQALTRLNQYGTCTLFTKSENPLRRTGIIRASSLSIRLSSPPSSQNPPQFRQ